MEQVQEIPTENRVYSLYEIQVGDVFESVAYPNYTKIPKGEKIVIALNTDTIYAAQLHTNILTAPQSIINLEWINNGYLKYVGHDPVFSNVEVARKMCGVMGIRWVNVPDTTKLQWARAHSRSEMNRLLLEYREAQQKIVSEELQRAVATISNSNIGYERTTLEQLARRAKNSVEVKQRELDRALQELAESNRRLANIADLDSDQACAGIHDVLATGWYRFLGIKDGAWLQFSTPEVTLYHPGGDDEDEIEVNMGQYKVEIRVHDLSVRVRPYINNLFTEDGSFHPHVTSSGELCWGNALEARIKATEERDIGRILTLARAAIGCYNSNSPFTELTTFEENGERRTAAHTGIRYEPLAPCWVYTESIDIPGVVDKLPTITLSNGESVALVSLAYVYKADDYIGTAIKVGSEYHPTPYAAVYGEDFDELERHEDYSKITEAVTNG